MFRKNCDPFVRFSMTLRKGQGKQHNQNGGPISSHTSESGQRSSWFPLQETLFTSKPMKPIGPFKAVMGAIRVFGTEIGGGKLVGNA